MGSSSLGQAGRPVVPEWLGSSRPWVVRPAVAAPANDGLRGASTMRPLVNHQAFTTGLRSRPLWEESSGRVPIRGWVIPNARDSARPECDGGFGC